MAVVKSAEVKSAAAVAAESFVAVTLVSLPSFAVGHPFVANAFVDVTSYGLASFAIGRYIPLVVVTSFDLASFAADLTSSDPASFIAMGNPASSFPFFFSTYVKLTWHQRYWSQLVLR
jgi:hypothetical protein